MEGRAVVPDRDRILFPAEADLEVVVLRDVAGEVIQYVVGLVLGKLQDPLRKAPIHEDRLEARDWICANHRALSGRWE